jgi:Domain of unknown function (DUF4032)/Lipopolysaccharide kinase (Kdo/WaaP) family
MSTEGYTIKLRPGHPDLLGLDWARSITEWSDPRLVDLPRGISRHQVRFVATGQGIYAIKELPLRAANKEYAVLRELEEVAGPAVTVLGLVVRPEVDEGAEHAAALITRYVDHSFSYRELISGPGFGPRRGQLLDAFAGLLAELHLLGCYWGDCSFSNVLYRYDAGAIAVYLVDAETSEIHPQLSEGQRRTDIEIMIQNAWGEMSDIAASQGLTFDDADLHIGDDIAARYDALWAELAAVDSIPLDQYFKVTERVKHLNELGFEVRDIEVVSHAERGHLHLKVHVADRNHHTNRLRELTGLEAEENQAKQILADLSYFESKQAPDASPSARALTAMRWRVEAFEPTLRRLREHIGGAEPIQAYCDFLTHRYLKSAAAGRDLGSMAALEDWIAAGTPGYAIEAARALRAQPADDEDD